MKKSKSGSKQELPKSITSTWRDEHYNESSSMRAVTMGEADDLAYAVYRDVTNLGNSIFKLQKQVKDLEQHLVDRDIEEPRKLRPAARGAKSVAKEKKAENDCSDLHPPALVTNIVTREINLADVEKFIQYHDDAFNKDDLTRLESIRYAMRKLGLRVIVK